MKRVAIGVGFLAGAVIFAAIFGLVHKVDPSNAGTVPGAVNLRVQSQSSPTAELQRNELKTDRVSFKSPGYALAFRQSHNYLEFVRSTIGAARSGDRDAQYYLGKAIAFCDETYRSHF
jgi:hypothetical protein